MPTLEEMRAMFAASKAPQASDGLGELSEDKQSVDVSPIIKEIANYASKEKGKNVCPVCNGIGAIQAGVGPRGDESSWAPCTSCNETGERAVYLANKSAKQGVAALINQRTSGRVCGDFIKTGTTGTVSPIDADVLDIDDNGNFVEIETSDYANYVERKKHNKKSDVERVPCANCRGAGGHFDGTKYNPCVACKEKGYIEKTISKVYDDKFDQYKYTLSVDGRDALLKFGKHRNKNLTTIADEGNWDYLNWILKEAFPEPLKDVCRYVLRMYHGRK